MNKYLIVRTSAIGDVVHTLPVLRIIKSFDPDCEIHWVVKKSPGRLLVDNPLINEIYILDKNFWSLVRTLRKNRYKAVFDFQGLYRSAFLSWWMRAEKHVGYSKAHIREKGAQFLYNRRISPDDQHPHVIYKGISLVCQYFNANSKDYLDTANWHFDLPDDFSAKKYIDEKLAVAKGKRIVVLNPGAGWGNKQLAPSHFGQMADILAKEHDDLVFVVSIAPNEEELGKQVIESAEHADMHLFNIDLYQLIALFRKSALFVGGDTGPMQIAAATHTPVLAIFGPTNPLRNGPFAPSDIENIAINDDLDCLNCHKRKCPKYEEFPPPCMLIEPAKLASLAEQALSKNDD